jgi:esterase
MSSVLREDSPLRDAVKKLIIVDVSLRHPSADKSLKNDHLYKLMETMNEINGLRIDKRVDVLNELRKVEKDEHVINFLLLNLFRSDDFFKFHSLELNHLMQAWPLLKSEWNKLKTNSFVPWEGEALFLKGDRSDYIRESDYGEMKKFFPNSSVEIIPNSGHWPHFDNQSVFIDKLIKFL